MLLYYKKIVLLYWKDASDNTLVIPLEGCISQYITRVYWRDGLLNTLCYHQLEDKLIANKGNSYYDYVMHERL